MERKRKIFLPILVEDKTKKLFDEIKGSRTADGFLRELIKLLKAHN